MTIYGIKSYILSELYKRTKFWIIFPMNPIFLRPSTPSTKTNLEKVHKLIKKDEKTKINDDDEKIKQNIPNNWFYNENAAKQVWDDLESGEVNFTPIPADESPFRKIDESANRIRNTISSYEVHDQELILDLLDIVGDDTAVDSLDQQNILMEARTRLYSMITEHVVNSNHQEKMLDSLRFWFEDLQKGKNNDDPELNPSPEKVDIKALLQFIATVNKAKEEKVETAVNLHEDIVSSLMKQVSEIQRQLNEKEFLLTQANDANGKRGRRTPIGRRGITPVNYDSELSIALRKIMELQNQITNLKQALVEYAKPIKEGESTPSLEPLISLEKELELDQKISVLTDEIKNLKGTNKYLQNQMAKTKQNEMVLENKLSIAEKTKKALDANIKSLNLKIQQMETIYEEKIKAVRNETLATKDHNDDAYVEASIKYQKQIQEMTDQHRIAIETITAENERRFRRQMKDLSSAYESGDQSKIVSKTVEHYNNEIKKLQDQNEKQLKEQQKTFSAQLMELAEDYEKILKSKDKDAEIIKSSLETSVKSTEMTIQMEYEEKMARLQFESQEKHNEEIVNLRIDFMKKVDSLKNKVTRITNERDAIRSIIENSPVATLIEDINLDLSEYEEEEEEDNDDDVLAKSLRMINEKEVEQKISEKYVKMIEQQKTVFKENREWELDRTKIYYSTQQDKMLSKFRENTVAQLQQLYRKIPNSQTTLEDLLMMVIKNLGLCEKTADLNQPMVPIAEVDKKLDNLKSKIIQLENENEIWKATFNKIGGKPEKTKKEDIVKAIQDSVQKQAEDFAKISLDRESLSRQVNLMRSSKKSDNLSNENLLSNFSNSSELLMVKANSLKYATIDSVAVYTVGHFSETSIKVANSRESFNMPQFNSIQKGATHKRPILNRTRPSIIFSYESDDYTQNSQSLNHSRRKNKRDDGNVCCAECSHIFPLIQNDARERVMKVSYVRCPDCLSPYNFKFVEVNPDDAVQIKKTPVYKTSENENQLGLKNLNLNTIKSDAMFDLSKEKDVLQTKLDVVTKQSLSLEQSFQERMNHIEKALINMRKIFFEYSLRLIDHAKNSKDKKYKIEIVSDISQKINDFNMVSGDQQTKIIDIIERIKLNGKQNNTDSLLEQCRALLIELCDSKMKFKTKKKPTRNGIISENKSIHIFGIDTKSARVIKDIKPKIELIKKETLQLVKEHQLMIEKLKKSYIELAKKNSMEQAKTQDLIESTKNELKKEKEENEKNKETIRKNQEEILHLEANLEESISKIQQLTIKEDVHVENIKALTKIEEESKFSIDSLTNMVLQQRDQIHQLKKEVEQLKLRIQILEAQDELNRAHKNCILLREKPKLIFSYPDDFAFNNELPVSNSLMPPPLNGLSNLSKDFSGSSTPGKQYTERLRVRYTNSDRPQSAAARVFVPKGKNAIPKTPRIVQAVEKEPDGQEGNSSIVVYVTPFLKDKPNKQPTGGPGLLPNNSVPNTAVPPPVLEREVSNFVKSEHIHSKAEMSETVFKELEKRIHTFEKQLISMQVELNNERDRTHEANQKLFKAAIQNQKAVREIKKQIMLKENATKGMMKAISMVSARDQQITKLTKKINRFNKLAASIYDNIEKNKKEEEKAKKYVPSENPEIDDIYAKIMKSLNNNTLFSSMAQNEMRTIERIQKLRRKAVEAEQTRIMGALDAMCFLTQPPMRPASSVKVTSTKLKKPRKIAGKRQNVIAAPTPRHL
ncbi:hypothetical protein TRFO_23676 [Tritrichomonas foetus]|uniref:Uncharacterized protein n=1 Tax=Tritrichomonas foetus TaxID=1144522 RepID=A0A1J4KAQ2_9EUKA|nr:hypothetical protein TRFO_23676 [Tritrichomonas foetus]|eukprot:OHT07976.1 hypothetical protein TRFO_23676 [Tritrichomonas foetus]